MKSKKTIRHWVKAACGFVAVSVIALLVAPIWSSSNTAWGDTVRFGVNSHTDDCNDPLLRLQLEQSRSTNAQVRLLRCELAEANRKLDLLAAHFGLVPFQWSDEFDHSSAGPGRKWGDGAAAW